MDSLFWHNTVIPLAALAAARALLLASKKRGFDARWGLAMILMAGVPSTPGAAEIDHAAAYEICMAETQTNPEAAYVRAVRWRDLGGGGAADHCAASAMMGMQQYRQAGERLEQLAKTGKIEIAMKARILGQASQAWLLADEPERAEAVASAALSLEPENRELLIDRAQAMAARKDYRGAIHDLDKTLVLDDRQSDALVFRATAKRYLGDLPGAMADITRALALDGGHVDGLLERGILHRLAGRKDAARQDWLMVLNRAPDSMAAVAARKNLHHMDVKTQP